MTDRPQRRPVVPLINPAAAAPAELAENFRRIYAGALADHRSIEAAQGVYAVRAVAPLEVTDEGVGLNWHDPRIFEVLADLIGARFAEDLGLVKVDEGDEADYLANQLVDYNGPTADWIGVDIYQAAAHDPLEGRVSKQAIQSAVSASGGAGSLEVFYHYKGTQSVTITLDEEDWQPRLLRVWARCAPTLVDLQTAGNKYTGVCACPYPFSNFQKGGPAAHWWLVTTAYDGLPLRPVNAQSQLSFCVYIDPDDAGHLKFTVVHPQEGTYRGAWAAGSMYDSLDVVQYQGLYYTSLQENNQGHVPNDGNDPGWWTAYTMLEAWFHARIDVMGTVPSGGATGIGNANS
jgi:hypothetical protein